ncbi:MAG: nucleoside phosphorylase [Firmicutes bacterium]|nr:nucleoside phosphorylase [Bacillota bacterium]
MKNLQTLYTKCKPGDIEPNVIFCGDPGRVKRVVARLDQSRHISTNREFVTFSGSYKGVGITVTSTGIGGPSAAIALEEMAACGMKVAVRIGTIMGLGDTELGDLVIPAGCMRAENTSTTYVSSKYPAVADPLLVQKMTAAARDRGLSYQQGLLCSYDGFYSEMKVGQLSKKLNLDITRKLDKLEKYDIKGIDMESGVIMTLSRLLGIKGGVVTMTTVKKNLSSSLSSEERKGVEQQLFTVVLEGLKYLAEEEL